jgi:phytoene synthase
MSSHQNAQQIFQAKSKSFSMAARGFSPTTRGNIARLYQFCRYSDDLADETELGKPEPLNAIAEILKGTRNCDADPVVNDFLQLAADHQLSRSVAAELIEALREDCGSRSIATQAELIRFAYGVAGTVGSLMQTLLGAHDPRAAPFAIDLGIGLQLTNIARDIAEDCERDRFYIPKDWVTPSVIRSALNSNEQKDIQAVDQAVTRLLDLASDYYTSALSGLCFIPLRNRLAVYFALTFYRAIGYELRARGSGAWTQRVRLSMGRKLFLSVISLPKYFSLNLSYWKQNSPPQHMEALHKSLNEIAR